MHNHTFAGLTNEDIFREVGNSPMENFKPWIAPWVASLIF